jgi:hypothetical protein
MTFVKVATILSLTYKQTSLVSLTRLLLPLGTVAELAPTAELSPSSASRVASAVSRPRPRATEGHDGAASGLGLWRNSERTPAKGLRTTEARGGVLY